MAVRRSEDVTAFSDFVAARSRSLFRTAYLVMGEHQLAQDLLQESLVKAYVSWPRIRQDNAEAYVRRIIVTTATSWRRRRSFHERPVERSPEGASPDRTDDLADHDVMWELLDTLPRRQRVVLVLRYYEDLSTTETAEVMGCSVGTVKSQTSTALAKLRDRVGPELVPFEDEVVSS